ncbi:mechanosensitive ion channel [Candidatus Woesearchaeota archaeon]|nr:mechanosensitive ion channel [Candidatus Woesearchaeota archaeon]
MQYPDIFRTLYFGNTILQYLIFFGLISVGIIIGKVIFYFSTKIIKKLTAKTKNNLDDILIDILEEPLVFLIVIVCFFLGYTQLTLTPEAADIFQGITRGLTTIAFAWFFLRFIDSLIVQYLMPLTKKTDSDLDDHLVPLIRKIIKVILIAMAIIMLLSNLGYDVTSIIAGLGIGGLAFALAAKDLLANLFGGLTIITDKPFKLGQWVNIGEHTGEVVEIGLRSTRLRTGNGEFITIPNSAVAEKATINFKKYKERLINFNIGLSCSTTNKKIQKAKEIVKNAVTKQDLYKKDTFEINFVNFGEYTYDLNVRYKVKTNSGGDVRKVQDAVNSEIKEKFEKEKIEMPFPTQAILLER